MNKIKLLGIIIGLLVLLNIAILSFLFFGKNNPPYQGPPNPEMRGNRIIEKFGFDDSQKDLFHLSREKHKEQSRSLSNQLQEASIAYYSSNESDAVKDSLYVNIASVTQEIYKANDTHFDEVRKMCTPDQLLEMDDFILGLLRNKSPKGPGRMRRR